MFTDCPGCMRQYRLTAAQLSAARGLVRCGFCGRQFDAMQRLHDRPAAGPPEQPAPPPREPEFEIPHSAPPRPQPGPAKHHVQSDPGLPPELAGEPAPPRRPWRRAAWAALALLLILAGLGQGLWFHRDAVLARYPELLPWADRLCDQLDCQVIRFRDLSAIRLVNRDVRLHPRFEESLLVNATMMNAAELRQPFPRLQLVLFNTDGRLTAFRNLHPPEYLDDSIDIDAGMEPRQPVHLVLEVSGATEGAVSFKFGFL